MPTSYFTWNGGYANNNFDDARNWYRGGTGPLPGFGDSLHFVNDPVTNVANPVNNFHAAAGGPYYAVTVNFDSTVTLSTAIITETFNMQKGNTSQNADGQDITVNASFGWTFGNINTSSYSGNLILARRIPYIWSAMIAPGGGTVSTGNTIKFQNGATGTFNPGTVLFTGGDGVEINANCSVVFAAVSDNIVFSKNAGQDNTKVWLKAGGTATVPGPKDFIPDSLPLLNEGGTFTVKGGATAKFGGQLGPVGQAASVRQTSGTLVIENGSTLEAPLNVYIGGGKLSTAAKTTAGDPSLVANIITTRLTIDGATVEIGDPAYDAPNAGHTFSTLTVQGIVDWKSGAARLSIGWNAKNTPDGDIWNSTMSFDITGGANGAKLGPRPPVNVGTHTLSGESRWVIYGELGTTISNNAASLGFELAAQGNDWENSLALDGGIDKLKLSHKETVRFPR